MSKRRRPDIDPDVARNAVLRAGRTRVRTTPGGAVDLSPEAIAERQKVKNGGMTGLELATTAERVFARAQQLAKVVERAPAGRRREKADRKADQALRTAAAQIRLAQRTPLQRGYLHALDISTIQTIKDEVGRAFAENPAALAVDTHRRIQDQRRRRAAEGTTP